MEALQFEGRRNSASAATWRPLITNPIQKDQQSLPNLSSPRAPSSIKTQPLVTNNQTHSAITSPHPTNTQLHSVSPPYPLIPSDVKESINTVQLNLVRLTLAPEYSPPATLPKRVPPRERKIPKYPIDATDSSYLGKWLHTLRLHKYEGNLQGLTPRELLELDEEELMRRGVDTVGARKKLLVVSSFFTSLFV